MTENHQPYFSGQALNLLCSAAPLRVYVKSVFSPFTQSQVMRISIPSHCTNGLGLPKCAVLKLYDRHWIDDREKQPWSPSREAVARAAWLEKKWEGSEPLDLNDGDNFDEAQWEEYYRQTVQVRFNHALLVQRYSSNLLYSSLKQRLETETDAYRRLSHLQGTLIPRFYAAVQVKPLPADGHIPETFVNGLILEDVGGIGLTLYDQSSMGDYTALGHTLMAADSTFPAYGVMHGDIRSHNILIASPTRIVIIDFGQATIRPADSSDEEWEDDVKFEGELGALQHFLDLRKVRAQSPFNSRRVERSPQNHAVVNQNLSLFSDKWVTHWYDEVPPSSSAEDDGLKEHDREHWRLKREVGRWLDSRPPPPDCYLLPRPGSPEDHVPTPPIWRILDTTKVP